MNAPLLISASWLIGGTGAPASRGGTVLVRGGRIEEVRVGERVEPGTAPAGVEAVHFDGCTLLPGLIDAHVHLCLPGDGTPFPDTVAEPRGVVSAIAIRNAAAALGAGITTLRDCGGFPDVLYPLRRAIALGYARGPRLVLAGWPLTITGGHCHYFGGETDGVDGVRAKVRETIKGGADYVKAMASGGGTPGTQGWRPAFSRGEVEAIVDEAHRFGYRATLHCTCAEAIANAVAGGVDEIQHASFMTGPDGSATLDPDVASAVARARIPVCPTLSVGRFVHEAIARAQSSTPADRELADRFERMTRHAVSHAAHLRALGVPFVAGSDAGWRHSPFDALHTELELMVAAGLTPLESLHAATGAAAGALGIERETGTIAAGLAADLLVVRGRPDEDVRALRQVALVMRNGARAT